MRVSFSVRQLDKLADLSIGLGHLFFGSTVIPFLFPVIDRPPFTVLALGLGFAFEFWTFAIWILEGGRK
ncbi:MAG: hypothetical protein AAB583_00685 [Patescibacteria group bacterium]